MDQVSPGIVGMDYYTVGEVGIVAGSLIAIDRSQDLTAVLADPQAREPILASPAC